MTEVSGKEFIANQKRYFDMAIDEKICIKRGKNRFHLLYAPNEKQVSPQPILEPDEDFYRAISAEEFRKSAIEIVEKVHQKFYGNERKICPRNA